MFSHLKAHSRLSQSAKVPSRKQWLACSRRRKIHNHWPTGTSWVYCGSGPAQCARAILLDYSLKSHIKSRRGWAELGETIIQTTSKRQIGGATKRDLQEFDAYGRSDNVSLNQV